jgi:orsellinic acid synthase
MAAHILLFGDTDIRNVPAVRDLYLTSRIRPQLRRFLQLATDVVQLQLSALAWTHEQLDFGHFDDLLDLAEHVQAAEHPNVTACAVLTTVVQVGELLCVAENDPSILSGSGSVYPFGLCIGLLAASVAAAARDTSEVLHLGAEVVGVCLRLGLEVTRRARLIEDSPNAWGVVLAGPQDVIEASLKTFNITFPPLRQAYVGVVTSAWTTVFGPPSTIAGLASSAGFGNFPKSLLPGTTAVHAPHFPDVDVNTIVGKSPLFERSSARRTVFSCSTSHPFHVKTLRGLIVHAVVEITSTPLWLEETVKALEVVLADEEVILTQLGPTNCTPLVQKLLRSRRVTTRLGASAQLSSPTALSRGDSELIAVVGMSGRFPGCNDGMEEFWNLLLAGTATHEEVPSSRFALREFFDPNQTVKNAVLNRFGCFLKDPGLFDCGFFKVSPREAMQMDPLHRMLLMTTYEALEHAGYSEKPTHSMHGSRISTFFSQTADDWRTINEQRGVDTHYAPCSNRAFASGRVAHYFGWSGETYSVDTACSSSATSIHLGCRSLSNRECDTAIVGGGSLCVLPEVFSGLGKGGFLSTSTENGSCKTFQDMADGYCRGEAVGVVVLKRLEDAIAENDRILAVIRGSARNSNAGVASITYPSETAQEALFSKILKRAQVDPHDVGFIEMHGTGTQAGDRVEMSSIRKVFAQDRTSDNPLYIGAVKANVGHSEAAAGVVSLIKSILMLRNHGTIPPQPGYPFALNRNFASLDAANIRIADGQSLLRPWPKGDGTRKLFVNNFDAAGGNTALLVQEAPDPGPRLPLPRCSHLIAVSGRTRTALEANKARLRDFLIRNPSISIGDLAYTTTVRRLHEVQREAFVSSSVDELCQMLAQKQPVTRPLSDPDSMIFIFTGQCSEYAGMGATLYKTSIYFRRILDSFQAMSYSLQAGSGSEDQPANFMDIITGGKEMNQASAAETQMAIVALEVALAQYWQLLGLNPSLVIGHSLGEYAALCVAGVISITDALHLVYERATLIERHCEADSYAMLAIALPAAQVKAFLEKATDTGCEISSVNGPSSTVVSGRRDKLKDLVGLLHAENVNVKSSVLPVRYGFHSAQMDPTLEPFEQSAAGIVFAKPKIPVASTLLSRIVTEKGIFGSEYLRNQMRQPVQFFSAVRACEQRGLIRNGSNLIEVGPKPLCANMVARSLRDSKINFWGSLRQDQDDWTSINTVLARAYVADFPVSWRELYSPVLQSVRLLDLPAYAFDVKNYWDSYRKQVASPILEDVDGSGPIRSHSLQNLPYTGLQFLEAINIEKGTAIFLSKTAETNLFRTIQGHRVDSTAICPASVLVDMATTAATYLLHSTGRWVNGSSLEMTNMNMTQPLVVHQDSDPNQTVRVHAEVERGGQGVAVRVSSEHRGETCEHGSCTMRVHSSSETVTGQWAKIQKLVKCQVKALKDNSGTGLAHRMNTALVYKLFGTFVDYSEEYMAIKEAFVALNFEEAAAVVDLTKASGPGQFSVSPFAVDGLVHLAGFLLNCNLSKPAADVYIANHIGSLYVVKDLTAITRQICTCFATVRERTSVSQAWCDVYVYDDQGLVAVCNVRFQKLNRDAFRLMVAKTCNYTVPAAKSSASNKQLSQPTDVAWCGHKDEETDSIDSAKHTPSSGSSSLDQFGILLGIITRHTGIDASEIRPSCRVADLGIDSLISMSILGDIEKAFSLKLPAGFFASIETVAEAFDELETRAANREPDAFFFTPAELGSVLRDNVTHRSSGRNDDTGTELLAADGSKRPNFPPRIATTLGLDVSHVTEEAKAKNMPNLETPIPRLVLVQGKPTNNERPLFLLPDGSGTSSGYIHLPALPGGRKIYALESPFVDRPEDYTLSIQGMAQIFIRAIRKEQADGTSNQSMIHI